LWLKPKVLNELVARMLPRDVKKVDAFLKDCIAQRSKVEQELHNEGSEETKVRKDMFYHLHQVKDPDTGAAFYTKDELESENGLLILAGLHSPSAAICGFFFYVTRNARVYGKVTNEIRSTFKSIDEISTGSKLSACSYLRACIDEALRLVPAGPAGSPREVLAGGLRVDGEFIPEGVEIGTSMWALHQNEDCFGDPHVFRPERWIIDEDHGVSAEDVARAQAGWYPFSHGPTICIGKNLAMMEIKIILARTLFQMDVIAPPGLTLGEGSPQLGWGRKNKNMFQFQDALMDVKDGPMIQVRKRALSQA
jgi:cytochrome P450